ncbi:MAG: polysaccharide pyruvyl transferase family protein [Desulfobacteraceae bacterium]|nr:polysaccharide pyruvyl transferase family protein [Desulfobacteraceae bacterium]
MARVLIAEDVPSFNKGEGALFFGIVASMGHLHDLKVRLMSTNPDADAQCYGEDAEIIDVRGIVPGHMVHGTGTAHRRALEYARFLLLQAAFTMLWLILGRRVLKVFSHPIWSAYLDSDVVILGHDSSWAPLYHGPLILFLRILGVKTAVYGATMLPARPGMMRAGKRIMEAITSFSLKKADLVTFRETLSLNALRTTGYSGVEPYVYPDLALLMRPASPGRVSSIMERERIPDDRPLVGMAFSRRVLRRALPWLAEDEDRIERACEYLANLVDHMIEEYGARVVFIPHSIGPTANLDDRIIADRILSHVWNKDYTMNIRGDYSPREIKGLCGKLAVSMGSRLHFAIDSASMGVPVMLLAYEDDIRCHGVIRELGGDLDLTYPVERLAAETIIARADALWNRRKDVKQVLSTIMAEASKRASCHGAKLSRILR